MGAKLAHAREQCKRMREREGGGGGGMEWRVGCGRKLLRRDQVDPSIDGAGNPINSTT